MCFPDCRRMLRKINFADERESHHRILAEKLGGKGKNEIDLVAIKNETRKILIGEIKTDPQKFDEAKLRLKAQEFLKEQKLLGYDVELRELFVEDMLD